MIRIEMLEGRRMMDGTADAGLVPPPDGGLIGNPGRGHSPVVVTIDNPDFLDDPNERLLTPNGKIISLPAASLPGMLHAISDPSI